MTVFFMFFIVNMWRVESKAPVSNRGITYQRKEKGFTKVSILDAAAQTPKEEMLRN